MEIDRDTSTIQVVNTNNNTLSKMHNIAWTTKMNNDSLIKVTLIYMVKEI